jgi:23S rRNA (pseudouridine1915-N3)-methyltransferase
MLLTVAHIGPKAPKAGEKAAYETLTRMFLDRIAAYTPTHSEAFATEAAFLTWLQRQRSRVPAVPVLLDRQGKQLASSELAAWLSGRQDQGSQHIVFAVGPPDGWAAETLEMMRTLARTQAALLLSFGPITMPHELARLVLVEQVYRAYTIQAGHPYHSGH